ncbi:MAG: hypothetical protein QXI33_02035 [Candidatus Pacearchaeota archaeon]
MKRGSRREFLFSSLLTTIAFGCSGYFGNNENDFTSFIYPIDESKIKALEDRKSGVIVSSKRGRLERHQRILEVKVFGDDGTEQEYYTLSVREGRNNNGRLSITLLEDNCVGDIIKFPTKQVLFNSKTGEYQTIDYFKDGSTYAIIDINDITLQYNPSRELYRGIINENK